MTNLFRKGTVRKLTWRIYCTTDNKPSRHLDEFMGVNQQVKVEVSRKVNKSFVTYRGHIFRDRHEL